MIVGYLLVAVVILVLIALYLISDFPLDAVNRRRGDPKPPSQTPANFERAQYIHALEEGVS